MPTLKPHARIESELFDDDVQIRELRGHESLSQLFEFDVTLITRSLIATEDLLAASATLILELHDDESDAEPIELRRIHGRVVEIRDLLLFHREYRSYRIRLVPRLWMTTLIETLDIFMGMTIGDIIERKLKLAGLTIDEDYQLRLLQHYPEREFVVQYKETDHAFLSRLCEHYGISYTFEHGPDKDIVVFSDDNSGLVPLDPEHIPFSRKQEATGVIRLEQVLQAVPKVYIQRDYNYRNPATDLTAVEKLAGGVGGGIVEYGGHFRSEQEGKFLAGIRSQEKQSQRVRFEGASDRPCLRAGGKFTLTEHPSGDAPLLVTSVKHTLTQPTALDDDVRMATYLADFTAISQNVTFRPQRLTAKPKISGMLTGIVDAEAVTDSYAKVDAEGRYRIRFMFDTSDAGEGKASRPVRMMQPHTGAGYGMHFPLRPGTEVLITFMDGDPDRPVIAGAVPNPQTASPVSAANAERNVIRTGGGNEINIDDTKGSERIKLTTPNSNTSFHLGASNNPEVGAMLQTNGSSSELATMGVTRAAGVGSVFSTLVELVNSSTIVAEAGKPGFLEYAVASNAVAEFAINVSQAALERELLEIQRDESKANESALAAATEAERLQLKCQSCRDAMRKAIDEAIADGGLNCATSPDSNSAVCKLSVKAAAYEEAANAADAAYLGLLGVMEDRNGIIVANREGTNRHFEVVMQNDVEAAVLAYDRDLYDTYTNERDARNWRTLVSKERSRQQAVQDNESTQTTPLIPLLAGDELEGAENKAAWIALKRAERAAAADQAAADAAAADADSVVGNEIDYDVASGPAQARDGVTSAIDTLPTGPLKTKLDGLSACLGDDCCGTALKAARERSFRANEAFATLMLDNTSKIQGNQNEQLKLANIVDQQSIATLSLTGIVSITSLLRSRTVRKNIIRYWESATNLLQQTYGGAGLPDNAQLLFVAAAKDDLKDEPGWTAFPRATHAIGSDESTLLLGKKEVTVMGKNAVLLGMDVGDDPILTKNWNTQMKLAVAAALTAGGAVAATEATSGYSAGWAISAGLATSLATMIGLRAAARDIPDEMLGSATVMGAQSASLLSPTRVDVIAGEAVLIGAKNIVSKATQGIHFHAGRNAISLLAPPAPAAAGNQGGLPPPGNPPNQPGPPAQGARGQGGIVAVVRGNNGLGGLQMNPNGVRFTAAPDEKKVDYSKKYDDDVAELRLSPTGKAKLLAGHAGVSVDNEEKKVRIGRNADDEKAFGGVEVDDDSVALGVSTSAPQLLCTRKATHVTAPGTAIVLGPRGLKMISSQTRYGNALMIKARPDSPSKQKAKRAEQAQAKKRQNPYIDKETLDDIEAYLTEVEDEAYFDKDGNLQPMPKK